VEKTLRFSLERGFPADCLFFDGHFSGTPIVPGAIILGYLSGRLAETGRSILRVERMKFVRPLGPNVPFETEVRCRGNRFRADFRDREGIFATATFTLRPIHG